MMKKVVIDGVEYIKKPNAMKPPPNEVNATHWAELPDGSFLFYRVNNEILLWHAFSEEWESPNLVPYTLYSFDGCGELKVNDNIQDPLFGEAVAVVRTRSHASISHLQRALRVGYTCWR